MSPKTIILHGHSVNSVFMQSVFSFGGGITYSNEKNEARFSTGPSLPLQYRLRITDDATSPDDGQLMLEHSVVLEVENIRNRLLYCKPIDIFNMVGLFVYMLRGSQSLADIEFYNPVARKFTDEEVSNTSLRANWGERIFSSGALARIIDLLRVSYSTRRAYLPVFQTEDIGFPSRNLPCLAGIQFSRTVSDVALDMFVTMRSQSAIGVLPYDLFLLTMLHEYVAMRVNAEVGTYVHFAPIFGIRERELSTFTALFGSVGEHSEPMEKMDVLTPGQKSIFLDAEKHIRGRNEKVAAELEKLLPPYWMSLLHVVRARRLVKDGGAWQGDIYSATAAFPYSFLEKAAEAIQFGIRLKAETRVTT